MRINVKTLKGRDCYPVVTEDTKVSELKCQLADELDIPVDRQRLVFQGKAMQDGLTLQQCGVKDGHKITLSIKEVSKADNIPSAKLDLGKELCQVLSRHFMPTGAQNITEQFLRNLHENVKNLSLDDIERIAQANMQNLKH